MNPLLMLILGLLLVLYAIWPATWIAVLAGIIVLGAGVFGILVARN